jgi:predicted esterase YcpF (UPF0227 family)
LHGFRSSPASFKARMVAGWMAQHRPDVHWWCPQLPASPRGAMELVESGIQAWPRGSMAIVGSSLGGFYATWLACRLGCKAVLLNPAVNPARDLARYIGEHPVWQSPGEKIFFQPEFVDELQQMSTPAGAGVLSISEHMQARLFAVIAKGDEVLSWEEMAGAYAGCHTRLLEGSDHGLSDFAEHLAEVTDFLGLA